MHTFLYVDVVCSHHVLFLHSRMPVLHVRVYVAFSGVCACALRWQVNCVCVCTQMVEGECAVSCVCVFALKW